jgi:hypothetical protein
LSDDDQIDAAIRAAVIREVLEPYKDVLVGGRVSIYCYRPLDGGCPAKEFLEETLTGSIQGAYDVLFTRHFNGEQNRGEKHHVWTETDCDGLAAYKHNGSKTRIVHTTAKGGLYVLLFGFEGKKENKIETIHIERAKRMQSEFRGRYAEVEARVRKQHPPKRRK